MESQRQKKKCILEWIQNSSPEIPKITTESITSWFLEASPYFPKILHIDTGKKELDLSDSLKLLISNKCIKDQTINYLKNSCENAPPPELVWAILNDIYEYSLSKIKKVVPNHPSNRNAIILTRPLISQILVSLDLPELPEKPPKSLKNQFKNGEFLRILYHVLTKEDLFLPFATNQQQANENIQTIIQKLISKELIDDSYISIVPLLASGDIFSYQQLLSMLFINSNQNPIERNYNVKGERIYLPINKINNGTTLPKLLTSIDPYFFNTDSSIFPSPKTEVEKKWNVKQCIAFLTKKKEWPKNASIKFELLFDAEFDQVTKLCDGILACYSAKFKKQASVISLKNILGLSVN